MNTTQEYEKIEELDVLKGLMSFAFFFQLWLLLLLDDISSLLWCVYGIKNIC
jgi:hypothetical protein